MEDEADVGLVVTVLHFLARRAARLIYARLAIGRVRAARANPVHFFHVTTVAIS